MKTKYYGHSKKPGVYQITNTINGKVYIGSAKEFKRRYKGHIGSLQRNRHSNKHLQRSFNKYGSDAFVFEVLEVVEGNKGERFKVEQRYLDRYDKENGWDICYNFKRKTVRKERSCFSSNPEETKRKLSESQKGRKHTQDTKKKRSEAMKKLWKEDPEFRKKCLPNIDRNGKPHSEKAKQKMSKSHKGKTVSPQTLSILSEAQKKRYQNLAERRKTGEITKKRWKDPEFRKKVSRKISESQRKRRAHK